MLHWLAGITFHFSVMDYGLVHIPREGPIAHSINYSQTLRIWLHISIISMYVHFKSKKSRTIGQSDNQTIIIGIIGHCHCSIIIRLYHGPWFYSYSMDIGDWGWVGLRRHRLCCVSFGKWCLAYTCLLSGVIDCFTYWVALKGMAWQWWVNCELNWTSWTVELAIT